MRYELDKYDSELVGMIDTIRSEYAKMDRRLPDEAIREILVIRHRPLSDFRERHPHLWLAMTDREKTSDPKHNIIVKDILKNYYVCQREGASEAVFKTKATNVITDHIGNDISKLGEIPMPLHDDIPDPYAK